MRPLFRRFSAFFLSLTLLFGAALADDATDALFGAAAAALQTPMQTAKQSGTVSLRTGDTAYVPSVAPEITPYDKMDALVLPPISGTFASSDPSIVAVDENGVMTGMADGTATVTYRAEDGTVDFAVTVSADALPQAIQDFVYVAKNQFYTVKRATLPKYNQYAKWYYGKKREVGWCAIFTMWCANASGSPIIHKEDAQTAAQSEVVFFHEGEVGNQYNGFNALGRFTNVPKPGYLVIYADLNNAYRTTHIGVVVDALSQGNGIYKITTVEGNMSNSVKSYCYLYDSKSGNAAVTAENNDDLQANMSTVSQDQQTDPLVQYALQTDHWAVFGFCATWQ